ncbi:MAG: CPBP family intramembrane glutamic endopeptidase [Brumimicrobium sp.]
MEQNTKTKQVMPLSSTIAVLVSFPIIATLISLLLLNRSIITDLGLDFFNTFWLIIIVWYILQIFTISKILNKQGWNWKDIGYPFSQKKTIYFISGYLLFAIGLLIFIELALTNSTVDAEKLQALSSLIPKTTTARIIFIIMGLMAGLAEEIVYRGFAIRAFESNKVNKWLAVLIATIPFIFQHGLKSIDQFWWFATTGIAFGLLFLFLKKLTVNIIIHWLVILSAMTAIFQVIE